MIPRPVPRCTGAHACAEAEPELDPRRPRAPPATGDSRRLLPQEPPGSKRPAPNERSVLGTSMDRGLDESGRLAMSRRREARSLPAASGRAGSAGRWRRSGSGRVRSGRMGEVEGTI
jgi:hypothetical protein